MVSIIKNVLGLAPKLEQAPVVPTDEVVPMHPFDDIVGYRNTSLPWSCQFKEVLDAKKLRDSLWQLLEKDGWRKMGGRLRKTASGKLEIHIPCPFTDERPPLRFSHAEENMRMADHPVASKLPRTTGKLETFPSPRYFRSLIIGPGAPVKFEDYLRADEPQMALHVVNFLDGTLVSLLFLHTLSDLMGFSSFLKSWSLAVAGKLDKVPPFLGVHEDPMAGMYDAAKPSTPYLIADRQLSGWRSTAWGIRFMLESWWSPAVESQTIGLPEELVMALRNRAKKDLADSPGEVDGKVPFVSDGDIMAALATRMACEEMTSPSNRSVTTILTADCRSRMPSTFREDAAYVQNAAVGAFSFGSASKILQTPLGQLALALRKDLIDQLELDQMIWLCRLNRESLRETGNGIMFGDTSTLLAVVSNWSKIHCFDILDFSPAITKPASADNPPETSGKAGHPVFWHLQGLEFSRFSPTLFSVVGRDAKGTMWLTCDLRPSTWTVFKEYLSKIMSEDGPGSAGPTE